MQMLARGIVKMDSSKEVVFVRNVVIHHVATASTGQNARQQKIQGVWIVQIQFQMMQNTQEMEIPTEIAHGCAN
jgi:hypothetical protein